ncbi:MAG: carbohydrate ABC transporter permease [Tyzzerella sp.]|nr:carbohydrate ABC transporter permease [Tyzzerella sp.]
MISSIQNKKLPAWLAGYKALYEFGMPVLGVVMLISGILCCFRAAEGSNSRLIAVIVFGISAFLSILMKLVNRKLDCCNAAYHVYVPKTVRKLGPSELIPLCVMTVIIVLPFWISIVTSIKTPFEAANIHFTWWPKQGVTASAYETFIKSADMLGINVGRAFFNSLYYATVPTVVGLFASSLSAFAFAKIDFRGKDALFSALLATIMMPGCVTMGTSFILFEKYGMIGTELPLIIPGLFGGAGMVMYLRQYYSGIPKELLESARMDGCTTWKLYFTMVLPLGKPALMAQFILGFISRYNDYMSPLIYLNDVSKYTFQLLLSFLNGVGTDTAMLAAGGICVLLPMVFLYVVFHKQILEGISMSSGLKG